MRERTRQTERERQESIKIEGKRETDIEKIDKQETRARDGHTGKVSDANTYIKRQLSETAQRRELRETQRLSTMKRPRNSYRKGRFRKEIETNKKEKRLERNRDRS